MMYSENLEEHRSVFQGQTPHLITHQLTLAFSHFSWLTFLFDYILGVSLLGSNKCVQDVELHFRFSSSLYYHIVYRLSNAGVSWEAIEC